MGFIHLKKTVIILYPMVLLMLMPLFLSCDKEDDIDDIFIGKTWYVTGATINGTSITGDDIKSLYVSPSSYMIYFSSDNTFNGILAAGSHISGSWNADGKKQKMSMSFAKSENVNVTTLSSNIYNVLKDATSYSGDVNNIQIKEDHKNFVRFTSNRNHPE